MELERGPEPEGCLTAAIRIPVRIVVLVVVLPVRMVWDALSWTGRQLYRYLLAPLGRALGFLAMAVFVWPWVALWRYVVVPPVRLLYRWVLTPFGCGIAALVRWTGIALGWFGRTLIGIPARRLYRWVLTPLGHGIAALVRWTGIAFAWFVHYGIVVPAVWAYRWILTPVGHAVTWAVLGLGAVIGWLGAQTYRFLLKPLGMVIAALAWWLVACPFIGLWRYVLVPVGRALRVVGREIVDAVGVCWRIAGYISRAVGRGLKWLGWNLVGRPVRAAWRWSYAYVLAPAGRAAAEVGRGVRAALRSARVTVRETRREVWWALFGGQAQAEVREPVRARARTLASNTTVPEAAPEPEISPFGRNTAKQG
ncbi:hypothetical protein [Streptomyces beijiangensis]|uniref:Uncharacterized protein n=1 Tax=Streptomyces beijiangensis TaxID=163361 RepID=A0A939JI30_9ACTN|nr:hypothetical protein [Streptomyces beijiangensis]MBO0512149.1 hypothetical protein [Streptomyces beijiangensis]